MAEPLPCDAETFWFQGSDLMDDAASDRLLAYTVELAHYINDAMAYLALPHGYPGAREHLALLFRNGHSWHSACRTMKWYLRLT